MFAPSLRHPVRIASFLHLVLLAACADGTGPLPAPDAVAAVVVDRQALDLEVASSAVIRATVRGYDGRILARPVAWSSEDHEVATVDQAGRVTAVAKGTTRIRAASEGKEARVTVRVSTPPVTVPAFAEWRLTAVNGQALPAQLSLGVVIGEDGVARYRRTMVIAGRMLLSVGNGRYQQDVTTETIIEGFYTVPTPNHDLGTVSYLWPGTGLRFASDVAAGFVFDGQADGALLLTRQRLAGQGEAGDFTWVREVAPSAGSTR